MLSEYTWNMYVIWTLFYITTPSLQKNSLGGNHISGMKQKYISTIIFTSKLEIVDIWQKKNAYIAQQQGTHTHKDMCTVTHSKQSVTMHQSVHPHPNLTWVNAHTHTRPHAHIHTQLWSHHNKYGTPPLASQDQVGEYHNSLQQWRWMDGGGDRIKQMIPLGGTNS